MKLLDDALSSPTDELAQTKTSDCKKASESARQRMSSCKFHLRIGAIETDRHHLSSFIWFNCDFNQFRPKNLVSVFIEIGAVELYFEHRWLNFNSNFAMETQHLSRNTRNWAIQCHHRERINTNFMPLTIDASVLVLTISPQKRNCVTSRRASLSIQTLNRKKILWE